MTAPAGVSLRQFRPGDWEQVCAVHDAARPDELRGSCDPRAFVPLQQDPEAAELRSSDITVAEASGRVIGFGAVDGSYLGWLYVHPDHYRQGIGRALLNEVLQQVEGAAWTIVLAGNKPAIRLYQEFGFREVNRYESDNAGYPCTCLRMEREQPAER